MSSYLPSIPTFLGGIYTGYKLSNVSTLKSAAGHLALSVGLEVGAHALGISTCKTAFKVGLFATTVILNSAKGVFRKVEELSQEKIKMPADEFEAFTAGTFIAIAGSIILSTETSETIPVKSLVNAAVYTIGPLSSYFTAYKIA